MPEVFHLGYIPLPDINREYLEGFLQGMQIKKVLFAGELGPRIKEANTKAV
jgi:hypothetical protein